MTFETEDNVSEETTAEETPAAEAPEETEAEAPAEAAAAAPAQEAEPEEQLTAKERRKRERALHSGEARPQRSIEERLAERQAERATKAKHRRAYRQKQRERRASEPKGETPPAAERGTPNLKVRDGIVVSDKADKTIIVRIDVARRHRMYKKIVRTSSTLHAHDESNEAHIGDTVRVIESRPISRTKRWRLVEVLERAR